MIIKPLDKLSGHVHIFQTREFQLEIVTDNKIQLFDSVRDYKMLIKIIIPDEPSNPRRSAMGTSLKLYVSC